MESKEDKEVQRSCMANALFKSIQKCHFRKVKFLLDNGVAIQTKNDKGQNFLVASLFIDDEEKRDKMFRFFLQRGVNSNEVDDVTGRTVLIWACHLGRHCQVEKILDFEMGNLDFHETDFEGFTPLHHAVMSGNPEVVKMVTQVMSKYRLSVDIPDKNGITPFIYAKKLGHYDISQMLLKEGNASSQQFDSSNYKTADDWAFIGMKERRQHFKREVERKAAQYKIKGKLPKVSKLPSIQLSKSENFSESETIYSGSSLNKLDDSNTVASYPARRIGISHNSKSAPHIDHSNTVASCPTSRIEHSYNSKSAPQSLPPISEYRAFSLPRLTPPMDSTVHQLLQLGFSEAWGEEKPTRFVKSEFDKSKGNEYNSQMSGSINNLMDILAEQQCGAYCPPVKKPLPLPGYTGMDKRKVSTLAIILGKSKTKRRKSVPKNLGRKFLEVRKKVR